MSKKQNLKNASPKKLNLLILLYLPTYKNQPCITIFWNVMFFENQKFFMLGFLKTKNTVKLNFWCALCIIFWRRKNNVSDEFWMKLFLVKLYFTSQNYVYIYLDYMGIFQLLLNEIKSSQYIQLFTSIIVLLYLKSEIYVCFV